MSEPVAPAPAFTPGQEVIWTGLSGQFAQRVTIETARRSWLEIFGETEADARLRYDIRDPRHGVIFGIPPEQLHRADRTLPGHPVKDGAGYDCCCGACLALPARKVEAER